MFLQYPVRANHNFWRNIFRKYRVREDLEFLIEHYESTTVEDGLGERQGSYSTHERSSPVVFKGASTDAFVSESGEDDKREVINRPHSPSPIIILDHDP